MWEVSTGNSKNLNEQSGKGIFTVTDDMRGTGTFIVTEDIVYLQ